MVKLNLQIFALNTSTSIVDYLKSQGQDSSFSARQKLASQYGISNYSGSASQNTQLLNALKNSSTQTKQSNTSNTSNTSNQSSSAPAQTKPQYTAIKGVDQGLVDTINSSYVQSQEVSNAKNEASSALDAYKQLASTPFQESQAYKDAMAYTNGLLEQLSSGRTSYTDQIKDLMGQIQNRPDFEYDVEQDTLFQQALTSAMRSGKSAMQDTIGQASALTGGYGSTYATGAGNQAYNAFIEDAYNNLPEYYQMALEAYQMEGNEMYQQLSMLNEADASEYQRMYDSWNANFSNAQQMYQQEYTQWQDGLNNAYNVYSATQGNADTLYAQEYQKWADEVANAMNYANMQNADYWSNQNFIESQRQFNEQMEMQKSQFAQEMAYKSAALAQDQKQFDATMAYNQSKNDYSGYINPDDVEVDENGNIIKIDGYNIAGTGSSSGISPTVNGFRTKKGDNFEVTIGENTYKVENEGKVESKNTLESIKKGTTYGNITIAGNGNAYIKNGSDYYRIGNLNGLFNIGTSNKSGYNDLLLALKK